MRSAALSHVRVLDLSRVLAGPWASQVLADLGADVVKVERPGVGDETRSWGPPWLPGSDGGEREAAYFASTNRGKRSVTIDLSRPEGQALVRRLASWADVLLENHKVGALARRGLGYGDLAPLNPRLVYCSISGFGRSGPYRDRPGYDQIAQGEAGLMSLTGPSADKKGMYDFVLDYHVAHTFVIIHKEEPAPAGKHNTAVRSMVWFQSGFVALLLLRSHLLRGPGAFVHSKRRFIGS